MKECLPVRITKMVVELHRRGYTSLYLYCGMSPSGTSWRYSIGVTEEGQWPSSNGLITFGSLNMEGEVDWAKDTSTALSLADGFVAFFKDKLQAANSLPTDYSIWFDDLVGSLAENELLSFYADYIAQHEHHLKNAPGYCG